MKIAIAGAGIGGLTAAILLCHRGHEVTVYDQFNAPRPVGSGLVLQPVIFGILGALGIWRRARGLGHKIRSMHGTEADGGRVVLKADYASRRGPGFGLAIHRAALFDCLHDAAAAAGATIVTGFRVARHQDSRLVAADGRDSGAHDLIVDALGAGSVLSPLAARPLPFGAIWGTVDWPGNTALPLNRLSQRYRRADRMLGVLPVGRLPGEAGEKATIFWSLPSGGYGDWHEAGLAAWREEAAALWPDMAPFVEQIADPARMTMARYSHGSLNRPWAPGLAHIGDAAHRTSPQLGQGANMAILDAWALACALEHAAGDEALRLYARMRRWHLRIYQGLSAAFTPQYQSTSRALPILRDRVLAPLSQAPVVNRIITRLVRGELAHPLAGSYYPEAPA